MNKLLHRAHLASLGIRWGVHPAAFVLHLPHKTAKMKSMSRSEGGGGEDTAGMVWWVGVLGGSVGGRWVGDPPHGTAWCTCSLGA